MDSRNNDHFTELPSVETPEDVAILYSWANLHGARYRDFSASRREYRAQLRNRAAEQARDAGLQARQDAEGPADQTENAARQADYERHQQPSSAPAETGRAAAKRNILQAAERAAAERQEAARHPEAIAHAEAAAASRARDDAAAAYDAARRQPEAALESIPRRRASDVDLDQEEVPGKISDPYTPDTRPGPAISELEAAAPEPAMELRPQRLRVERPTLALEPDAGTAPPARNSAPSPTASPAPRRPQGYRPDDASGVREIYRGPEPAAAPPAPARSTLPIAPRPQPEPATPISRSPAAPAAFTAPPSRPGAPSSSAADRREAPSPTRTWSAAATAQPSIAYPPAAPGRSPSVPVGLNSEQDPSRDAEEVIPRRRKQDQAGYRVTESDRAIAAYRQDQGAAPDSPRLVPRIPQPPRPEPSQPAARIPEPVAPVVPAWLEGQQYMEQLPPAPPLPLSAPTPAPPSPDAVPPVSVSDTLQRSRERVASRWYALKGVFETPGQDRGEPQPVRQKETRTPILAVFSFAGGVGKTSLVATLGRSLSSLGEKVLLTDTTSHGLLPFYFGASELREGTIRTFSPPSGSTDAPIYLVNYAVDQLSEHFAAQVASDDHAQEHVAEEITKGGRGAHRVLLDLTSSTGWLIRRMAHLNPTVLVPLAPDMNSVISLQAIERFLHGIDGHEGTPLQVFYLLNQFDASLPLHLDVREVLRRQLGERLLPFVIRRAPAVSEALAEGMTIFDYAADAPVAEDYMNVASWLRTVAAPATAGFRNVRWSER